MYCPYRKSLRRVLPLLYNHFAVYCLYFTITSPCTSYNVQSLRRVLSLLYNHFAVYCLYCTCTSTCIAFIVQSLRRVLPLPYNHFMYCLYLTITSPCTVSTAYSLQQDKPICYKNRSTNGLYPRSNRPKPTEQNPAARDAEGIQSLSSAQWLGFPRITAVHSRWVVTFVSIRRDGSSDNWSSDLSCTPTRNFHLTVNYINSKHIFFWPQQAEGTIRPKSSAQFLYHTKQRISNPQTNRDTVLSELTRENSAHTQWSWKVRNGVWVTYTTTLQSLNTSK